MKPGRISSSLAPNPGVVGTRSELPGIVLDQVLGKVQSHDDDEYKEITRNYQSTRSEYLRALVARPVPSGSCHAGARSRGSSDVGGGKDTQRCLRNL
jgi:hypothetical protein